jgi:hypothetical protein
MAYYSGTAASLTALRTALLTHAQADGWVLTGDVLSRAGVFFQIQETATNVTCLGCEDNAVLNPAPNVVSIGRIYQRSGYPTREMTFPCNYEVFGFAQELYLVANYDTDSYQWMGFGKSTVPGLIKPGGWCAATIGLFAVQTARADAIDITAIGGGGYDCTTAAAFWHTGGTNWSPVRNSWVNHGLDGHGWTYNGTLSSVPPGIRSSVPLIGVQPSVWNSESTLLPIRAFKQRPSFKSSMIVDLSNARHFRVDNVTPGDIITIGSDKWQVFPWYRKNLAVRNGGFEINHTGTFGWAIRYEGP